MQMNEYSHTHNLSQQLGGQQPRTMMMNLGQQPMMSSLSQPQHPGSQQQPQQQQQQPQQQRLPQQQPTSVGAPPGSSSGSRPLQSISSLSRQPSLGPTTSALPAQQSLQRQTSNPLSGVHPLNTINGQSIQQGQKWPGQDGSMSGVPSGALFSMGQAPSSMGGGMHPGYHSSDMVNLLKGGYAHVATGMNAMPQMNNDGPRFDMANDFPSLGDVVGKSSSHHSQSSTSSQPAPSPTHNTQFAIQNEDFPSLQSTLSNPSSLLSPSNQAPQSSSLSTSDPSLDQNGDFPHLKDAMQRTGYQMQPQRRSGNQAPQQPQRPPPGPNQGQGQVPNYATSAMPSQSLMSNGSNPPSSRNSSAGSSASSTGIPPSSASSILSSSTSTSAAASPMSSGISLPDGTRAPVIASSSSANTAGMDRYGLTGLLSVIRMTDPDLNTLALGTDLTTLGLNLNSTEVLYATFAYPCLDTPTRRDPDYVLPYCYYMQPPALKTSHLSKFQLETLFYIFYNMPKDTLQVYAAKELYNRDWRYHKEMKLWFTRANDPKANPPDMGNGLIYFDCTVWERAIFRDTHLLAGVKFMTEEELAGLL